VGVLAAIVYVWDLTISGYANVYYSAAAQAAALHWKAWFFGSLDPANWITLDKPPLATMLMGCRSGSSGCRRSACSCRKR
jgi:hypothetical protein